MTSVSTLWPLLAFALVVVLIPLALWALKRAGVGGAGPGQLMRVVSGLALSPSQKVMVVELGTGPQARWLVLGVGANHITPLLTLDAPAGVSAQLSQPQAPAVAELLERFRQGPSGGTP